MKGLMGWIMMFVLIIAILFVIAALASGNTVGDGVRNFFEAVVTGIVSVWNYGG